MNSQFSQLIKEIKHSQLQIDLAINGAMDTLIKNLEGIDDLDEGREKIRSAIEKKKILEILEIAIRQHAELMHELADHTAITNKKILEWSKGNAKK